MSRQHGKKWTQKEKDGKEGSEKDENQSERKIERKVESEKNGWETHLGSTGSVEEISSRKKGFKCEVLEIAPRDIWEDPSGYPSTQNNKVNHK